MWVGVYRKSLYFPLHFYCEPKTDLKKPSFKKKSFSHSAAHWRILAGVQALELRVSSQRDSLVPSAWVACRGLWGCGEQGSEGVRH